MILICYIRIGMVDDGKSTLPSVDQHVDHSRPSSHQLGAYGLRLLNIGWYNILIGWYEPINSACCWSTCALFPSFFPSTHGLRLLNIGWYSILIGWCEPINSAFCWSTNMLTIPVLLPVNSTLNKNVATKLEGGWRPCH